MRDVEGTIITGFRVAMVISVLLLVAVVVLFMRYCTPVLEAGVDRVEHELDKR